MVLALAHANLLAPSAHMRGRVPELLCRLRSGVARLVDQGLGEMSGGSFFGHFTVAVFCQKWAVRMVAFYALLCCLEEAINICNACLKKSCGVDLWIVENLQQNKHCALRDGSISTSCVTGKHRLSHGDRQEVEHLQIPSGGVTGLHARP